jgi:hypothetical protein
MPWVWVEIPPKAWALHRPAAPSSRFVHHFHSNALHHSTTKLQNGLCASDAQHARTTKKKSHCHSAVQVTSGGTSPRTLVYPRYACGEPVA